MVSGFKVRANARQSERWRQAAQAEGFDDVASWLAAAAEARLKDQPLVDPLVALAWQKGASLWVRLEDGEESRVHGWISPPFGSFRGNQKGPGRPGSKFYTLVYLPDRQIIATLHSQAGCRTLAAHLASTWGRPVGPAHHRPAGQAG